MAVSSCRLVLLAAPLALSACNDSGRSIIDPVPVPATIAISGASVLSPVENGTYRAEVRDEKGEVQAFDVNWSVSDGELASIDDSGLLTASGTGTVYVVATAGSIQDSLPLRITRS